MFNWTDKKGLIEEVKELIAKVENTNDNGRWVTINGTHVFIPDGKQVEDVMKEKGWLTDGKTVIKNPRIYKEPSKEEKEAKEKEVKERRSKALKEQHEDYIKTYKDIKKEGGQSGWQEKIIKDLEKKMDDEGVEYTKLEDVYKREADVALSMMAHDYEKRGNKRTVERSNELREKLKSGEDLSLKDKQDIDVALKSYKNDATKGDKTHPDYIEQKKSDNSLTNTITEALSEVILENCVKKKE